MKKNKKSENLKNTYVELDVTDMTPDGNGVGRTAAGVVVFVPGALTGDRVRAKLIKSTVGYCVGRLEALLSPSPERVESDCPHSVKCGGCVFSELRPEAEARFKQKLVNDALRRIGGLAHRMRGHRNRRTDALPQQGGLPGSRGRSRRALHRLFRAALAPHCQTG